MIIKIVLYSSLLLGILWSLFSFLALIGEVLPYQDVTPAMLREQAEDITFWGDAMLFGLFISVMSGAALFVNARKLKSMT